MKEISADKDIKTY